MMSNDLKHQLTALSVAGMAMPSETGMNIANTAMAALERIESLEARLADSEQQLSTVKAELASSQAEAIRKAADEYEEVHKHSDPREATDKYFIAWLRVRADNTIEQKGSDDD